LKGSWQAFSFAEVLRPPTGSRVEQSILTTYSADPIVLVTALLALSGADVDSQRGSRLEVVRAIELLRSRVRILAQAGRILIPRTKTPIVKLLDRFVLAMPSDETAASWHPKVALIRFRDLHDASIHWRCWIGSRNLTMSTNWEAGIAISSRTDGRGQTVPGLSIMGGRLASLANLEGLKGSAAEKELGALTWDLPAGCDVSEIALLPQSDVLGLPRLSTRTTRVVVVSPFLDLATVRKIASWGNKATVRTLLSTAPELQRIFDADSSILSDFATVVTQTSPELPGEGGEPLADDEAAAGGEIEDEDLPDAGLHAKFIFASESGRRHLWIGSANATQRGWNRNVEVVVHLEVESAIGDAVETFVGGCKAFVAGTPGTVDDDEEALESARKALCGGSWIIRQEVTGSSVRIDASSTPPISDALTRLDVALLGGTWNGWRLEEESIQLIPPGGWQRSELIQLRVVRNDRMCSWLQFAPCTPPPDKQRDDALISEYLDPKTFLMWIASELEGEPLAAGGAWDLDGGSVEMKGATRTLSAAPTMEAILRAWARDPRAFSAADEKIRSYLAEIQRRTEQSGTQEEIELLRRFNECWITLTTELA
jgi:hypothetical protein